MSTIPHTRAKPRPRVAYVRGSFLNPFEAQYLTPLQDQFNITAVKPRSHRYDVTHLGLPVQTLHCADYLNGLIPRNMRGLRVPNLLKFFGAEERLFGLEDFLPGFDLVHTAEQTFYCSYQIAMLKRLLGFKLITIQDEINPFWFEAHAHTMRRAALVRQETDLFIARTERAKMALVCEGADPERIQVIGHGVDLTRFSPASRSASLCKRLGIAPDQFVILFVGRLVWEKGIFSLADAARQLLNDPRFKALNPVFVLAGEGEERAALQRRLDLLGVAPFFRLIGNRPYDVLPDIHRLADIFVLPSISTRTVLEQFGIVLIEAMATGKPIVSTHCGAIDEVVGDAGVLVQPNDCHHLWQTLRDLALNAERRRELGAQALTRVTRLFAKEVISAKIAQAYGRTLGIESPAEPMIRDLPAAATATGGVALRRAAISA
jgi:glycosyltransferase involved in cell wall biosynthesis